MVVGADDGAPLQENNGAGDVTAEQPDAVTPQVKEDESPPEVATGGNTPNTPNDPPEDPPSSGSSEAPEPGDEGEPLSSDAAATSNSDTEATTDESPQIINPYEHTVQHLVAEVAPSGQARKVATTAVDLVEHGFYHMKGDLLDRAEDQATVIDILLGDGQGGLDNALYLIEKNSSTLKDIRNPAAGDPLIRGILDKKVRGAVDTLTTRIEGLDARMKANPDEEVAIMRENLVSRRGALHQLRREIWAVNENL
jgi:hypothetical protein